MKTSRQLTLPFGEDVSTSSQEAFRASRSALQASEMARTMTVTSGRKCCEQFAKFVPAGSWARTFADLLIGRREWFSTRCSLTWKLSATKYSRLYFQLVPSTLPTAATECGLLPTVQTQGLKVCENGKSKPISTGLLPTPHASDASRGGQRVTGLYKTRKSGQTYMSLLNDLCVSNLLPTPTARDFKPSVSPTALIRKNEASRRDALCNLPVMLGEHCQQRPGKTSQLNPLYVADMMGFPPNWTVSPFLHGAASPSKPTETP